MKEKIIFSMVLILFSMFLASAEYTLSSGECKNFTFQTAVFDNSTNETVWFNQTERFCADDSNDYGVCQVKDKIIDIGDVFTYTEGSCDLDISCATNTTFYDVEFPWSVYKSVNDEVTLSIGDDFTETFDVGKTERLFTGMEILQCPTSGVSADNSDTPEDLLECLTILKNQQKEEDLCPGELEACERNLIDMEGTASTRGKELDLLQEETDEAKDSLDQCTSDNTKLNGSVVLLMIMAFLSTGSWIVYLILKLINKVKAGSDLK